MDRIDTAKVPKCLPRPAAAADVAKVLAVICSRRPRKDLPLDRLRDRVLFETAYVCGARASEVCGLYVEDLDLRLDDEQVRIHGKAGSVRTVLLDDRGYAALLKLYLARAGYTAGRCFAPRSTAGAGRCPTTPLITAGRATAPPPRWRSISTSCATHTPPSSSTPAPPSRPSADASATLPPKPPSCTPCWTTRSPTPRSVPHADAGTGQRAKEASQPRAASAHCNQDPSHRQRLSARSSTPDLTLETLPTVGFRGRHRIVWASDPDSACR